MNVLILAAGAPTFQVGGENYPLYLTEIDGLILLQKIVNQCAAIPGAKFTFVFNREEVSKYHLDDICRLIDDCATVISIDGVSQGAACTALYSAVDFDPSESLLVMNANQLVDVDLGKEIDSFVKGDVDAGVFVFDSAHPRYSYVRIDSENFVIEAAERRPISRMATTGVFWFKRAGDFVSAVQQMIRNSAAVEGNFYVAPALNELVLTGKKIAINEIDRTSYHPIKSEKQLSDFEQSYGAR